MIKIGDKVKISYIIKVEDSSVEEVNDKILTIGDENILNGINKFLLKLCDKNKEDVVGIKKKLNIKPIDAFGEKKNDLIVAIPKDMVGDNTVDDKIMLNLTTGESMYGSIMEEKEDTFIVDCNHPLADKSLVIDIEIVDVV